MKRLHIVMYHYVRDLGNSRYPLIKGLDYILFKKQIEFLEKNFHIVTMETVLDCIKRNTSLPARAALLTFDDGYIDHYTFVLPILKSYGIQGSFFVTGKTLVENTLLDVNKIHFILASTSEKRLLTRLLKLLDFYRGREFDFPANEELLEQYAVSSRFDTKEAIFIKRVLQTVLPERLRNIIATELFQEFVGLEERKFARELYMNRDQIRMMKDSGMFIGLHGYEHYWLGNISKEQMENDIRKALKVMDEFIDGNCWVMNYPYGSRNAETIEVIKQNGCVLGLTTEVRIADLNIDNAFEIPRLDTNDFPPKSERFLEISKDFV